MIHRQANAKDYPAVSRIASVNGLRIPIVELAAMNRRRGSMMIVVEETDTTGIPHAEPNPLGFMTYFLKKDRLEVEFMLAHPDSDCKNVFATMFRRLISRIGAKRSKLVVRIHEEDRLARLAVQERGFKIDGLDRNHYGKRDAYRFVTHSTIAQDVCV